MKDKYNDMVDNITSHMLTVMFWGFSVLFFYHRVGNENVG